jgi:hypothetical protein
MECGAGFSALRRTVFGAGQNPQVPPARGFSTSSPLSSSPPVESEVTETLAIPPRVAKATAASSSNEKQAWRCHFASVSERTIGSTLRRANMPKAFRPFADN